MRKYVVVLLISWVKIIIKEMSFLFENFVILKIVVVLKSIELNLDNCCNIIRLILIINGLIIVDVFKFVKLSFL